MAQDHWNDSRNTQWERERRREQERARLESQADYGQADEAGRRFEEPADDRGYRPFGDTGPIYTASGAYGPDGKRYGVQARDPGRDYRSRDYPEFEADQRRRHRGDYHPDRYTPNPREGRGQETRSWWDRTQDELSSWFGDDEARRRRQWDENRTEAVGDHRGRGPKGYRRSDERIRDDVSDRLTDDPYLDASGVEVTVKDGEVTLVGVVFRREDKRRAEDVAERASGVSYVQNNLRQQDASGPVVI
ncbi:MAG: transport-associated protein [Caulobacteraceae bacterium]|nr:transport-associated protein [Caulobacteraceae bacterium]